MIYNEFNTLLRLFDLVIPEGMDRSYEIDGKEINISKKDGKLKIKSNAEYYDDSNIKKAVSKFKSNVEKIDDDLFVKIVENLEDYIDVNEFDRLLDLEEFNSTEASEVFNMMECASDVIRKHLYDKIESLKELCDEF